MSWVIRMVEKRLKMVEKGFKNKYADKSGNTRSQ